MGVDPTQPAWARMVGAVATLVGAVALAGCEVGDDVAVRAGLSERDDAVAPSGGLSWISTLEGDEERRGGAASGPGSGGSGAGAASGGAGGGDAGGAGSGSAGGGGRGNGNGGSGSSGDGGSGSSGDGGSGGNVGGGASPSGGKTGGWGWSLGHDLPPGAGIGKVKKTPPVPTSSAQIKGCETCSLECSDDDACTFDVPNDAGECLHLSYSPKCQQSVHCGAETTCDGDYCVGRARDCTDDDPCTADACDPVTGACANLPLPGCAGPPCGEGDVCAAGSYCTNLGRCAPLEVAFQPLGPLVPKLAGQLRVLTYNTLFGFSAKTKGYHPKRGPLATAWLAAMKPDVVVLQELTGWEAMHLAKVAGAWGHAHVQLFGKSSFKIGLTSAQPIEAVEAIGAPFVHGLLDVRVAGVHYIATHLYFATLKDRLLEAAALSAHVQQLLEAGEPVMVLGDFNALSPYDQSRYALETPWTWYEGFAPKAQPQGYLSIEEISALSALGMVDVQAKLQSAQLTSPTHLLPNGPWGIRVDYVMVSPSLADKVVRAWVADAPQRRGWSDHFPVVADFAF